DAPVPVRCSAWIRTMTKNTTTSRPSCLFRLVRGIGLVLGGLIGLVVISGVALYLVGLNQLNRTYPDSPLELVTVPTGAEAVARGQHLAVIWSCTGCHGADLSGGTVSSLDEIPLLAKVPAPNLTAGRGGIGQAYSDTDWVRAIRQGISSDHRAELFMYT